MKKYLSMLLVSILSVSFILTGCSKGTTTSQPAPASTAKAAEVTKAPEPAKKVTLRVAWWGNQVRNERTQKVFELYSKLNPNVSFESEFVDWSGYWDKLATQIAANTLPDIIQQDYAYIGQYIEKKLLEDLTPYTKSGAFNIKDISENIIKSGSMNSGFYAISLGTNSQMFLFDPAVFEKAGVAAPKPDWSWKDYEDTIVKIYEKTKIQSDPLCYSNPYLLIEYLARQSGKTLYNKEGTALGFDDVNIVSGMFEQALKYTKAGVYPKPDALVSIKALEDGLIVKGQSSSAYIWSNQFIANATAAKRPLGMALMPKGGTSPGGYLKPSQFFSVSAKSANKDASVKFVDYFVNDIDANKILLAERGVPVSSKVRDGIKASVDEFTRMTFDFIALAEKNTAPIDPPEPPGAAEISKAAKDCYDEAVFEKTSAKDAAAKFMKAANTALAKNKK